MSNTGPQIAIIGAGPSGCYLADALGRKLTTARIDIYDRLPTPFGLVRGGVGTALVGSYEEVADRIEEYHALGNDAFIMSGYPHLEEAYWFGEGVMPILRRRGLLPELQSGPTKVFSFR